MVSKKRVNHFSIFERLFFKWFRHSMSDETYAKWSMKRRFGNIKIDLENPKTFNEKIQWLKLHDRKPIYTKLVDKYAVREHVESLTDKKYLTKLIGVWDRAEDINFDELPESFVLKTTQASGTNIIVKDKSKLNIKDTLNKLTRWLEINYYKKGREWVYKDVAAKIICEELLADEEGNIPLDFKFFCFNGQPTFVQLDLDRFGTHERLFYDMEWQVQPFGFRFPKSDKEMPIPENFNEMVTLAKTLAKDIPFCRIDFYALPKIIFGEITFYPSNGTAPFHPVEWDLKLGELIKLPAKND